MLLNADPRYPILDGFLYDVTVRSDLKFRPMAIEQFEVLRRSGSYRSRMWCIPPDSSSNAPVIPAYDSYELQIQMIPGSVLWGFIWTPGSNEGPFSINARDACTDVWFFNETIRADEYDSTNGDVPPPYQQSFPRPIVIGGVGLVSVEICSQQSTPSTGLQLAFCGAEPVAPRR